MSIPASTIASVTPGVLSAGGSATSMTGLFLTSSTRVPIGQALSFPTATAVSAYFGPSSAEFASAQVYFAGFDGSDTKPGAALFAQYPTAPVSAWLRGSSLSSMTLAQLQALTGTLTLTIDGVAKTSAAINLASATSFSAAAALISAGFTSPNFTVAFDSVSSAFVFTSSSTGATSSASYASGTLAGPLGLTQAGGAALSPGAVAATPGAFMTAVATLTQNWVSFTTLFNPDSSGNQNKLAFAAWNAAQNNRYIYAAWDNDPAPTASAAATTSFGNICQALGYSGVVPIYEPGNLHHAAFLMGAIASLDFTKKEGRATMAFRSQSGITPSVTDPTVAANLDANGYNFYGDYATSTAEFTFFYPGSVCGKFGWIDSFVNQVWLTESLRAATVALLLNTKSIPYNAAGDTLIKAALQDPITAALNFGAIRTGVSPSSAQAAEVNNAAGVAIDKTLTSQGYYLQVSAATTPASVRAQRGSPPVTLWYMDGESVQSLSMSSISIQ